MSRCELTGKAPVVKNLVSHSNIKTKSRAYPNVQKKTFFSHQLGQSFKLKVATSAIKTMNKVENFDAFLMQQTDKNLSKKALAIKKKILKKTSRPAKPKVVATKKKVLKKVSKPEKTVATKKKALKKTSKPAKK